MIVCADDFGLTPSINKAILLLCRKKSLGAVSVLINNVSRAEAEELKANRVDTKIGLHIDLFGPEIFRIYGLFGVKIQCESQIQKFIQVFGFFPDFIDGHMHCQIYPICSKALIETVLKYQPKEGFFIRSTELAPEMFQSAKNWGDWAYLHWVNRLGKSFKKKLAARNIRTNDFCWGVFNSHADIRDVFEAAKRHSKSSDVLFVHPGIANEDSVNRVSEFKLIDSLEESSKF